MVQGSLLRGIPLGQPDMKVDIVERALADSQKTKYEPKASCFLKVPFPFLGIDNMEEGGPDGV